VPRMGWLSNEFPRGQKRSDEGGVYDSIPRNQ
jgi:hypothetical protein